MLTVCMDATQNNVGQCKRKAATDDEVPRTGSFACNSMHLSEYCRLWRAEFVCSPPSPPESRGNPTQNEALSRRRWKGLSLWRTAAYEMC